jgi:hypothetical protein
MVLLFLPWKNALASQFPGFRMPHNPMLDPIQQYLPWRIYAVESLRSGLVPLWNPYSFMGTPFLANLQSALLYPPNLVFLLTGAARGFGVSAILHLIVGGLLMYGFLRALALRPAAATLGALVFMFNGFTVAWLEYPTLSLWTYMWLPGVLFTYERAARRPASLWPLLCAVALALTLLGGHLQIASYVMIAFAIYAVARAVACRKERHPVAALALFLLPLLLALALAAAQLLPTLELAAHSGRVSHGLAGAVRTRFPLTHLVLYLIPNFFGNPSSREAPYWGNFQDPSAFNFFETACYAGILPLLLAVWGLRRWRELRGGYFALLIAFALLCATGPLYPLLYYGAPGFRELAGLGRILCLAAFGIAGLAAVGIDELVGRQQAGRLGRVIPVFLAVAALCAAAMWALFQAPMAELSDGFSRYFHAQALAFVLLALAATALIWARARLRVPPTTFAAAALALVTLDLFWFGIGFNPYVDARLAYPETDSIRWLKEHAGHQRFTSLASHGLDWMPHNSPMIFGLRDIHGSDSLRIKSSFDLISPPGGDQSRYPEAESGLLDVLGVRYLMTDQTLSGKWRLAYAGEAPIYENTHARPRAFLEADSPAASNAPGLGAVEFVRDDPDRVEMRAEDVRPGAVLVVMDSYHPGWRATVDGRPAETINVNGGFRGVHLSPGTHTVEMQYQPGAYRVGLFVSLLALAVVCASAFSRASAAFTALRS